MLQIIFSPKIATDCNKQHTYLIYLYYLLEQKNTGIFWFSSHFTFFRKHIKQKNVVAAIIMHNTRAWGQVQGNVWGQWGFFPIYFLADALTLFKSGVLHRLVPIRFENVSPGLVDWNKITPGHNFLPFHLKALQFVAF